MIKETWYYAIATLLLAFVDFIRIKKGWGKEANVDHAISTGLAAFAAATVWYLIHGWLISWYILFFTVLCLCVRGMLYDIPLNKMLGRSSDYVSEKSSSQNEQRLNKVGFWQRRMIFAGGWILLFISFKIWNPIP